MVLSVTKTINIVNPFYRINTSVIKVVLVLVSLFWCSVNLGDLVLAYQQYSPRWRCLDWLWNLSDYYIGVFVLARLTNAYTLDGGVLKMDSSLRFTLLGVHYILPSMIVLVCMAVQMCFIRRVLTNQRDTANHANLTVLLVSLLFFVCNSAYAIMYASITGLFNSIAYCLFRYTLPLLNAALFPLIIILRKDALRRRYRNLVVRGLCWVPRRLAYARETARTAGGTAGTVGGTVTTGIIP